MDIIKITPDKERAKSILKMVYLVEERIKIQDKKKMAALIIADYYEIIKELITAILLLDGYKTLSHKDLIDYLKKYSEFELHELSVLDDLRILRNRITYEGFFIDVSYLDRNERLFKGIVKKLKDFIGKRI
ncbi:MAG: hypothetical protein AABY03_00215 [Nanoarchaeota archaeon]